MSDSEYMLLKSISAVSKAWTQVICTSDLRACRRLRKLGLLEERQREFRATADGINYVRRREVKFPEDWGKVK